MVVSAVGSVLNNNSTSATSNTSSIVSNGTASPLNQQQFLRLLVAQLQNQDPTNPVSQAEFTSQLAQLSQLDSLNQLNSSFSQLLLLQGLGQGAGLIGKKVQFTPENAKTPLTGTVDSVNVINNQIQLQINGTNVPLSQVNAVLGSGT